MNHQEILCGILVVLSFSRPALSVEPESQPSKAIFADNFEGRTKLGESYTIGRGRVHAWNIREGVLYGEQVDDDHGATMRKPLEFDDLDLEFDFRFNGGTSFNVVIDDMNEKSVWAGHICRVSVSPKRILLSDDKLGGMNLEIRKLRQSKSLSPEQQASLNETLRRTRVTAKVAIKQREWHKLRVRISGDMMTVSLNEKHIAELKSTGLAHPTKTQFGMTVNGSTIDYDNLRVLKSL